MNTKLIIVEGLPSFGKTTTANLINEIFIDHHTNSELYLEGNLDHPADYEGMSYFTNEQFGHMLSLCPNDLKKTFLSRVIEKGDYLLLPYEKIKNEYGLAISDEILELIYKHDIYELPLDQHIELMTARWAEFADKAKNENKLYIFECCLIQNPITIGMIKYGEQQEKVINYVSKLADTIEKLNPVLFYIEQDDLESSFKKAVEERPTSWSSFFIDYYTKQEYGIRNKLQGLDGTLKVLEARRKVEAEIYDRLNLKKQKLNNTKRNINEHKSIIREQLVSFGLI